MNEDDEEFYVCPSCGHEDHADKFGVYCPACGENLDEIEAELIKNEEFENGSQD